MSIVPYEAAETIRRKKAQYCRLADTNQWHLFPQIALPTATFKFVEVYNDGAPERVVHQNGVDFDWPSLEGFLGYFSATNKHVDAVHMVNAGELEMARGDGASDGDEVKAVFTVVYHAGAPGRADGMHGTGAGHYHETWRRVDGDWFLERLWMRQFYWKVQGV
ncbi:hypothetical protein CkaCkLH20_04847 [Colletotrichum karsti]|uniref:SnoaL-like domain-containing protein n=1 Tax=Colletotrichum karsti TaxID=1095194 RepID=A0A9P6LMP4_9PEZI|nr:uncharacterized protein CkaCkLH20_04847 [Colletotrichum karsti]KAF9877712.1 hypothetical protein CkaCkLH20_04847 [Colletotrichum karsti]